VVIYLENHSFDNVLGFWCNANPGRCPDGGMPARVTLSDGTTVTPGVTPDKVPNVGHSVEAQQAALNIRAGVPRMNGWQNIPDGSCSAKTGYQCISGYRPARVPNLTTLADRYAISDDTFSMADSPSWGGHLYAVTGTLDHFEGENPQPPPGTQNCDTKTFDCGWGCDSHKVTPWVGPEGRVEHVPSCVPDPQLPRKQYPFGGAFEATPVRYVPTIMDRLQAAGLPWKIYGAQTIGTGGYQWSVCPSLAECLDTRQSASLVSNGTFEADARAGNLPAFSLITAGGAAPKSSCHNLEPMTMCDNWAGSLVNAVGKGPDWFSTAVFITFDDCGCFYDQVPPPKAPDGTQNGPRVPLIIVSPYAKPGYTDTTPASFASILAYTEHTFGLAPLTKNDAQAYDFSGAFNYSQVPLRPARMVTRPLPRWARHFRLTRAMLDDPT
jgi:phospholipase C